MPVILATDPVKYYEALAAGKPVVSSEIPSISKYQEEKGLLYLAKGAHQWIESIEKALQEDSSSYVKKRQLEAKKHTWKENAQQISLLLYEQ